MTLDRKTLERLYAVFDEDGLNRFSLDEYYGALDAYEMSVEEESYDNGCGIGISYKNRALIKLVAEMEERELTDEDLYDYIDADNDGHIDMKEFRLVLLEFDYKHEK